MTTATINIIETAIESFMSRFAGIELVSISSWYSQDEDGYCTGQKTQGRANDVTLDQLINVFTPDPRDAVEFPLNETLDGLEEVKDLIAMYNECCDNGADGRSLLMVKSEYLNAASEAARKQLESAAASFAAKHNTGGVNVVFIQKIIEELQSIQEDEEQWNSGECRAERYARSTSESFYSDNDYVSGKREAKADHLHNILNWVQSNCPLLWAKYEESQPS